MLTSESHDQSSSPLIEIDSRRAIRALSFSANGDYIVSGHEEGIQVWRVKDGKKMESMEVEGVQTRLAVSKDGGRIAAATLRGDVIVWDANTYKQVCTLEDSGIITALDFSPDATRLVTASISGTATVWDVETRQRAFGSLRHDVWVIAAKYSPRGRRIATATLKSVRVYDGNDGNLLVEVSVTVTPWGNNELFWSNAHILIVSDGTIKRIESSTGSLVSEWPVADANHYLSIVLSQRGEFLICSENRTVTFWDTTTHAKLGAFQHTQNIYSIALSLQDHILAICGTHGEITVHNVSHFTDPVSFPRLHTFQEPDVQIDDSSWKDVQLANLEALLTSAIPKSRYARHQALARRALARTRLKQWEAAIDDAKQSIEIKPSIFGYIAKSVALVGKGEKLQGYRACDIAFRHLPSTQVNFFLLAKAVIVFMAGDHDDAILRLDDLIAAVPLNSVCYVVQAYMYLLIGNLHMESRDYRDAIKVLGCARTRVRHHESRSLLLISLISGWDFDDLGIRIRQRLCEAWYAAGCKEECGVSLVEMVNTFDEEIYTRQSITEWVSVFSRSCLSVSNNDSDAASKISQHDEVKMDHRSLSLAQLVREWAKSTLASGSWKDALVSAVNFMVPRFTIYRAVCEHLRTTGRIMDAIECLQQMLTEWDCGTDPYNEQMQWILDFKQRCAEKLAHLADAAADTEQHDDAIFQYSVALSLGPTASEDILIKRSQVYMAKRSWTEALDDAYEVITLDPSSPWTYVNVLIEWAKVELTDGGSWRNVFTTAGRFKVPRFTIYRALCECLEVIDRMSDATECFHEMMNELAEEPDDDLAKWIPDFKFRCCGKSEHLGDFSMMTRKYDEAVSLYTAALSLDPADPTTLFGKRSMAHEVSNLWEEALNDANEVITLDPSSSYGYERKYAALRGAGHHADALDALNMMLLKMSESPDPDTRERSNQYVKVKEIIRRVVRDAIRDSPQVLVHTTSGRLCNKYEQATAFESSLVFLELISCMTTQIDHARIEKEVANYYRYAMLSHKWEDNEPLFEKVIHTAVYNLEESPTHDKLQKFCTVVLDAGFHWAWSDTCCINKADHHVLQEALVLMFKWYEGSSLTIVLLHDVRSPSQRGDLVGSIWNQRAWTLQEYHASRVVRFYNEDWTPYLNPDIPNHKESPEIISEMKEVTGISAHSLMALQPGLDDIRDKLRLASTRQTTRVEDEAYSLLGIFSAALPIVYGEGDKALGRLLAQLLMSSGDASILAWTGRSGSFNSCLPADISVFSRLPTTHIPPTIRDAGLDITSTTSLASSLNSTLVMELYDRLNKDVPSFTGQRMKLPCITFKLGQVSVRERPPEYVFRAQTVALGIVEIKTKEDLSRLDSLYLIHPWIDFLLDRQPVGSGVADTIPEPEEMAGEQSSRIPELPSSPGSPTISGALPKRSARFMTRLGIPFAGWPPTTTEDVESLRPPSSVTQAEKEMRALRVIARMRQPFGALLLTPHLGNVAAYRRVATDCLIRVQVEEISPTILNKLVNSVRVFDVV